VSIENAAPDRRLAGDDFAREAGLSRTPRDETRIERAAVLRSLIRLGVGRCKGVALRVRANEQARNGRGAFYPGYGRALTQPRAVSADALVYVVRAGNSRTNAR